MKAKLFVKLLIVAAISTTFIACQEEEPIFNEDVISVDGPELKAGNGFRHGIVVEIDGEDYYFDGAPDGPAGAYDVPGHSWSLVGKNKVNGKHYNTGPFGASNWWSSDADDGALLYIVHGIIDYWSPELAMEYFDRGFVHRHEFRRVSDGAMHPNKVIWLKHTAVTSFTLDGGPMAPDPPYEHWVTPGVDLGFPNNYNMPYPEDSGE